MIDVGWLNSFMRQFLNASEAGFPIGSAIIIRKSKISTSLSFFLSLQSNLYIAPRHNIPAREICLLCCSEVVKGGGGAIIITNSQF